MLPAFRATDAISERIASAYGLAAATRRWALMIRDDAISSMARVIFWVDLTEPILRFTSRSFPAIYSPEGAPASAGVVG